MSDRAIKSRSDYLESVRLSGGVAGTITSFTPYTDEQKALYEFLASQRLASYKFDDIQDLSQRLAKVLEVESAVSKEWHRIDTTEERVQMLLLSKLYPLKKELEKLVIEAPGRRLTPSPSMK